MEYFNQRLHIFPNKNLKVKIHGKILLVITALNIQRLGLFFLQMDLLYSIQKFYAIWYVCYADSYLGP